jgi:thiosulfate/3-mercaptopyruvate sulfurtransferase
MDSARESGLITPAALQSLMEDSSGRLKLVDASYPSNPALPAIGNAVSFDIDDIADPHSSMAHMLPSPELFAEKIGALGISNDDFVVAYDQSGFTMAASRAWWMFRVFGHANVVVLDGGLSLWLQNQLPVGARAKHSPVKFTSDLRPELVRSYEDMQEISATKSAVILDARPPERFVDHIPNSKNVPAMSLMESDRTMISPDRFKDSLRAENIDPDSQNIVATCGSGVTACSIALALFRGGKKDVPVYDGSWTEWSSRK